MLSVQSLTLAGWDVLSKSFSAVSVGIAFDDASTGWTSFTDGASAPTIVRTKDGGATWNNVNSTGGAMAIPMAFASTHDKSNEAIATTGLLSDRDSHDGDNFERLIGAPAVSQSLKFEAGRFVTAGPKGVCTSAGTTRVFTCNNNVPLKNPGTGRYASSPSKDVVYFTSGTWPSQGNRLDAVKLSRNVAISSHAGKSSFAATDLVEHRRLQTANETYTAELWKSADGGATWKNLLSSTGEFYFNDIHCLDETHCVAVGEGFSNDGSTNPGARVYTTTDGETFTMSHAEADPASLMTARMLSATEFWAGGTTQSGAFEKPLLALHSKDGGATWTNEDGGVKGQMITAWDFVEGGVGYATTVNALQVSSLLKYTPD
jgi:photosystem II stability/assembly factor-like uncharacterized protein